MLRFSTRPNRADLVHWREWGGHAFEEAQTQDRPIILFLTAFWCGFCQRLDETTLSSDEVIALLNTYFVPIRVEESQRPDVDLRYNQDGWPTVAFLSPAGNLLFSVNYLPAEPFIELLIRVVDCHERRVLESLAPSPVAGSADLPQAQDVAHAPSPADVAEVAGILEGLGDPVYGGFGSGDKLLHTDALEFFLYLFEATGEERYLRHVLLTLDSMRQSKLFDAKDGGFFRYSSQPDWQEPHPEKLLDDQAALLGTYLHAYLLTEETRYAETARDLLRYLDGTLLDPGTGMFCGCQDYVRVEGGPAGSPEMLSVVDSYVYCDANARAASAYLVAWWLLGEPHCRERALHVLDWIWGNLRAPDGGMYHYWHGSAHAPGLLMDAVRTGQSLLQAFALTGDERQLDRALNVAEYVRQAHRGLGRGFVDIARPGPGALRTPIAVLPQNAALAGFFLELACLSGESEYRGNARWALQGFHNSYRRHGAFAAGFGQATAMLLSDRLLVTVAGAPGGAEMRRLLRTVLMQLGYRSPVICIRAAAEGEQTTVTVGSV